MKADRSRQDGRGRRVAAFGIGVIALTLSAGCQHQDLAERRWNERLARVMRTAQALEDREASNPKRLAEMKKFIEEQFQEDVQKTAADMETMNWYFKREFERWERNQPEYREWIEHELRGHPERIEENAIIMFF